MIPGRNTLVGRTALEGRPVHIPDCLADPEYDWPEAQQRGNYRSLLGVPMLREGESIGVLALTRSSVRPFSEKQPNSRRLHGRTKLAGGGRLWTMCCRSTSDVYSSASTTTDNEGVDC